MNFSFDIFLIKIEPFLISFQHPALYFLICHSSFIHIARRCKVSNYSMILQQFSILSVNLNSQTNKLRNRKLNSIIINKYMNYGSNKSSTSFALKNNSEVNYISKANFCFNKIPEFLEAYNRKFLSNVRRVRIKIITVLYLRRRLCVCTQNL